MKKVLVLYYSTTGNTELIAQKIATTCEGELEEVKLENPNRYRGFLKYALGGFDVFRKLEPQILPLKKDPKAYDIIFIGTPMWNRGITPAIRTLLAKLQGLNKKIYFFYTQKGNHKKLQASVEALINKGNTFGGALGFRNVKENVPNRLVAAEKWATEIIDQAYLK